MQVDNELSEYDTNSQLRAFRERNMKLSDITPLGHGVYELEEGVGDLKIGNGDLVELRLGGIETDSTPSTIIENADLLWDTP